MSEKHPEARAWDDFLDTKGAELRDATTLGADAKMSQYLEHRLATAFKAGIAVGKELKAQQVRLKLVGQMLDLVKD